VVVCTGVWASRVMVVVRDRGDESWTRAVALSRSGAGSGAPIRPAARVAPSAGSITRNDPVRRLVV